MKRTLVLLLLLAVGSLQAQQLYGWEKDIRYYADSVNARDAYIASQCTLDLYYPKDKKDFATIIWFHGGGLTGGRKEVPRSC